MFMCIYTVSPFFVIMYEEQEAEIPFFSYYLNDFPLALNLLNSQSKGRKIIYIYHKKSGING